MEKINVRSREAINDALDLSNRAMELDPSFSTPYGLAAACYSLRKNSGWMRDEARESEETRRLAMHVQRIGGEDGRALAWAGRALVFVCREYDVALSMTGQATRANPNLATVWSLHGTVNLWCGHYEEGVEQLLRAIRMSPVDPEFHQFEGFIGWGYVLLGNYAEAIAWATRSWARRSDVTTSLRVLASAHALAGHIEEAKRTAATMIELEPQVTMSHLRKIAPYRRREDADRVLEGLRLAGLPE
jgi:tetratricopeptide (TPR) repeat protein